MSKILVDISLEDIDTKGYMILHNAIQKGANFTNNATNGDILKALFPNSHLEDCLKKEWWDTPYKEKTNE